MAQKPSFRDAWRIARHGIFPAEGNFALRKTPPQISLRRHQSNTATRQVTG